MKFSPNSLLRALAIKVLPVPGAPNNKTPEGRFNLKLECTFGNYRNMLEYIIFASVSTKE